MCQWVLAVSQSCHRCLPSNSVLQARKVGIDLARLAQEKTKRALPESLTFSRAPSFRFMLAHCSSGGCCVLEMVEISSSLFGGATSAYWPGRQARRSRLIRLPTELQYLRLLRALDLTVAEAPTPPLQLHCPRATTTFLRALQDLP